MKRRHSKTRSLRTRTEPRLGDAGDLEFRDAGTVRAGRAAGAWTAVAAEWISKPALTWLLGAGLLLLVAGTVFRKPLADWLWAETRALEMRDAAAAALARGHLTAEDGSGARELYQAAIAIDPDRPEARTGLVKVGRAALAQAQAAASRDDFEAARRGLHLARELAVPREETDTFAERLREREAGVAGIEQLLLQAAEARQAGRFDGSETAALPIYRRILALQPQRVEALEGREDTLSDLLQQARGELQRGDIAKAAAMIDAAEGFDRGHIDLPGLRGELTRAVDARRARADADLRRGALDRARAGYAALLAVDARDETAMRGRERVAVAYARRARQAAADFRFAEAEAALHQARELAPESPAVGMAERGIAQARQARARLPVTARKELSKAEQARVSRLLELATEAEARGDLLGPPGESAFDHLRTARGLAPEDAAVRKALAQLVPAAQRCFQRELPRNDLGRAGACLDAWAALGGEGEAYRAARNRLARRWLAVGDERLGAGELPGASAALRQAETLDGQAEGLVDFRQRLRAVSVSGD